MTGTEFILLVFLFAAVGYILWLEKQPTTDAERRKEDERRERLAIAKENERAKRERIKKRQAEDGTE